MFVIIWEYHVKEERAAEFETVYGDYGAWTELFRKASGYLGTDLLQHFSEPDRYTTIDRWSSAQEYELFLSDWKKEYESLDAQCEGLTESETSLGKWEAIPRETR